MHFFKNYHNMIYLRLQNIVRVSVPDQLINIYNN